MVKQKKGFTLIELLIVVAIIAILAAIAIPNFLQAQVRSKVARAEADMASVAVALESYEVDNDTYPYIAAPIAGDGGAGIGAWFNSGPWNNYTWNGLPLMLTTPVSYLSSGILWDPFPDLNNNQGGIASYRYTCNAQINVEVTNDVQAGDANWYDADNPVGVSMYGSVYGEPNANVQWIEWSNGPACYDCEALPTAYDPTNGTVSNGNIYRFGP